MELNYLDTWTKTKKEVRSSFCLFKPSPLWISSAAAVVILSRHIAPGDAPQRRCPPPSLPAAISHYRRDASATRGDAHNRGFNDSFRFLLSKAHLRRSLGGRQKRTTTEQTQSNKSRRVVDGVRRGDLLSFLFFPLHRDLPRRRTTASLFSRGQKGCERRPPKSRNFAALFFFFSKTKAAFAAAPPARLRRSLSCAGIFFS